MKTEMHRRIQEATLLLLMSASCCFANANFNSSELLVDGKQNVTRQCAYIASTMTELAGYVATNKPAFPTHKLYPSGSGSDRAYQSFSARDTWVKIGSNGWFYFKCHSLHSEWNWKYQDVGDLSIGIDNTGRFFFNRSHVCGELSFKVPASGRYADITDFLKNNPSWHPLPLDWKRTAPPTPEVDIASFIIGNWSGIMKDSDGVKYKSDLELDDRGYGNLYMEKIGNADEFMYFCSVSYKAISADAILIGSEDDPKGKLSLTPGGNQLSDSMKHAEEDFESRDRLTVAQKTNSVEVIYFLMNSYTGVLQRVKNEDVQKHEPRILGAPDTDLQP